jgi:hypothetical protein
MISQVARFDDILNISQIIVLSFMLLYNFGRCRFSVSWEKQNAIFAQEFCIFAALAQYAFQKCHSNTSSILQIK